MPNPDRNASSNRKSPANNNEYYALAVDFYALKRQYMRDLAGFLKMINDIEKTVLSQNELIMGLTRRIAPDVFNEPKKPAKTETRGQCRIIYFGETP